MSNNVDYHICPECMELNSAIVWFVNENMYQIVCKNCAHEYECGQLPWESIRLVDMDVYDDRDAEEEEIAVIMKQRFVDIYTDVFGNREDDDDLVEPY